ncbi:P-loop containing nucleoside triphosphate hydrolase protein [Rhizodiscina lignyota]|uniref:P-loop containing nucleoside triphosphate hydrolase protein n=1 Tax=Rhizodiscina lignyota TaxID=1504668 RepID=A0A9P4M8Q8_9PEZI|nr:P-loop containing nucleoside triphosphate hydrolase protein [Rhizodiscina lignyota]
MLFVPAAQRLLQRQLQRTFRLPLRQRSLATFTAAASSASGLQQPPVIRLRDYQEQSIQSVLDYVRHGHRRLGISLATGSGKTIIFTQLIDRIEPPNQNATQTLILVHRRELVEQAARHCTLAYPSKSIEVEMGNNHASGAADISIASIQSIMSGDRISKFDPHRFKLILVDEAHHIVAPQYLKVLEYFGLRPLEDHAPVLVGVSATFSRNDGVALGAAIDHIVYHKDYIDMIDSGWLADLVFTTVQSNVDLRRVRTSGGDFQIGSLSEAVNTNEANEIIVQAWKHRVGERKSTLVFCVDKAHVTSLTAMFRAHRIHAEYVTSDTARQTRTERLDMFKRGEIPVLLNCGIFTEGTDIPNIDCVLLARPTKSQNLLIQMIGRGVRQSPGKKDCLVIDMVSTLKTGIVTTPTLFGLNPDELVEEADVEKMRELKSRREREEELERAAEVAVAGRFEGSLDFTTYDTIHDLIADTSVERHIRGMSLYAWVNVGDGRFVLVNRDGDYIIIEPDAEGPAAYSVRYLQKIPAQARAKSPYMKPRQIARAETFSDAVKAADTCADFAFERQFALTRAYWRKAPATDKQVDFLNKFREEDSKLEYGELSKGSAADMITKIQFGARGRFKKAASKARSNKQ